MMPNAWNFRGVALHELGRYAEAVGSYDKAIAINPDYAEAKLNRNLALKKQT
jgi:tetratricopeptide (TPR) repeat protein